MLHNEFKKKIEKLFPSLELVTLESLTKKIAIVSQVRIGDNQTFKDYEEVSWSNLNKYGLIKSTNSQKPSLPADEEAVMKHQLNAGDLLLSYRAKTHIKVLRVEEKPKRIIVGSTSSVRIEFKSNLPKEISVLVQSYLELDAVQNYIRAVAIENQAQNNTRRYLISPKILKSLLIPKFTIHKELSYQDIFKQRYFMMSTAEELMRELKDIHRQSDELLQSTLPQYQNNKEVLEKSIKKDAALLEELAAIQKHILRVKEKLTNDD